jgi:hypothetical protein
VCGKRIWLKPSPLSTGMGDHPGSVARPMSSSDVGLEVELDGGKHDQPLLSQPIASSCAGSYLCREHGRAPRLVSTSFSAPRAVACTLLSTLGWNL